MSYTLPTFWQADKATSQKIRLLLKEEDELIARGLRIAARFPGADRRNLYYYRSPFGGDVHVSGLIFENEADVPQKLFKRMKNVKNGWAPRNTGREARALAAEFAALRSTAMSQIMRLCGIPLFDGARTLIPAVRDRGDYVYIAVGKSLKSMKGCKRISDLIYEARTRGRITVSAARAKKIHAKRKPTKGNA